MPIQKPDYQLSFDLDLPEVGASTGFDKLNQQLSAEEVRLRSETARQVFEGQTNLKWMEEYSRLRDGGWDWRVAAYIAWASSPRVNRNPKTQEELARQHLGLTSDRAITTWRIKNHAIDEMVALLQASPLWDYRAEVFTALTDNAKKPDYKTHNDRKLFLELTGDYVPSSKLAAMITKGVMSSDDMEGKSDAELANAYRDLAKQFDYSNDPNKLTIANKESEQLEEGE